MRQAQQTENSYKRFSEEENLMSFDGDLQHAESLSLFDKKQR